MIGKTVFIQELGQFGIVKTMSGNKVETVEVQTPDDGPKIINVLEKGYKIISLILALLKLFLNFFGK